jgi:hypothetical protein
MATGRYVKLEAVTPEGTDPKVTMADLAAELAKEGIKCEAAGFNLVTVVSNGRSIRRWECYAEGRANA